MRHDLETSSSYCVHLEFRWPITSSHEGRSSCLDLVNGVIIYYPHSAFHTMYEVHTTSYIQMPRPVNWPQAITSLLRTILNPTHASNLEFTPFRFFKTRCLPEMVYSVVWCKCELLWTLHHHFAAPRPNLKKWLSANAGILTSACGVFRL